MKFFDDEFREDENQLKNDAFSIAGGLLSTVVFCVPVVWNMGITLKTLLFLPAIMMLAFFCLTYLFCLMYYLSRLICRIYYRFEKPWKKILLFISVFLIFYALTIFIVWAYQRG